MTVGPFRSSQRIVLDARPTRFGLWASALANSGHFTKVKWTSWQRRVARGKGYATALHARKSKHGRFVFDRYKVRLRLSGSRLCGEVYEFTRIRITSRFGSRTLKIPNAC
jgi:hypothetical protein